MIHGCLPGELDFDEDLSKKMRFSQTTMGFFKQVIRN